MKVLVLEIFEQLKRFREAILLILSVLILVGQFAGLSAKIYQNSDIRAVVYAQDNDGARAIQTTMQTRWWNSNHFAPYGPLYFRLSHTLASFIKPFSNSEMNHHWALMMISLICLYAFCFLVSSFLFKELWLRLAFTVLALSLLDMPHWVYMVFRPHPDMLLLLMVGLATKATADYIFEESKLNFRKAAIFWGVAVGTKATTILFTPAFVFLFFPLNKSNLKKLAEFVMWMFLAYTIIGFPQSLSYFKVTKFLIFESRNSVLADFDSVLKYVTYAVQGGGKLLLLILLTLGSMLASFRFTWTKQHTRLVVFVVIPFATMLMRQMLSFDHHFVLPFVSCLLVGLTCVLTRSLSLTERPLFVLGLFVLPLVPANYENQRMDLQKCRAESREFYTVIGKMLEEDVKVLHDPYLSFPAIDKKRKMLWGISWQDVENEKANVVAIRESFYRRYLKPSEKFRAMNQPKTDWPERNDFYSSFAGKIQAFDPQGRRWHRVYENSCGMFIYRVSVVY